MQTHAWFRPVLREWDDIVLLAMPLFHIYGNIGILATSLIGHHPLALVPEPARPRGRRRTIERTRCRVLSGRAGALQRTARPPARQQPARRTSRR